MPQKIGSITARGLSGSRGAFQSTVGAKMPVRVLKSRNALQQFAQRGGRHLSARRRQAGDLNEAARNVTTVVGEHSLHLKRNVGTQEGWGAVRILAQPIDAAAVRVPRDSAQLHVAGIG